jgi:hypothetical protein
MFEIGVFCVILFALGYWATLFIMGRREDVLHGEFVEAEPEPVSTSAGAAMPLATTPPATVLPPKPVVAPAAAPPPAVESAPAEPVNTEALQSLLASIKQELKNAAQI